MKSLLLLSAILTFNLFVFSQRNSSDLWANESFANYPSKSELTDRRSANEKHFLREDGQVDMFVSSDPINYFESGAWNTIYTSISEESIDSYKFSNYHNVFKSYYAENIQDGFKTLINSQEIFEMRNASMYYEKNGEKLANRSISASSGNATQNILNYSGVYGDWIDLRVTQLGGKRKLDYIIKSKDALDSQFLNAEYLVFSEDIILPDGWGAKLENGVILLIDKTGKVVSLYESPLVFDSNQSAPDKEIKIDEGINTSNSYTVDRIRKNHTDILVDNDIHYEILVNGSTLTILTKVRMSHLLDERRVFPVVVDPTLTVNLAATGTNYYSYTTPYGPPVISTSGAPAGSSITNTNLALNVTHNAYRYWFFGWIWSGYSGNCGAWHVYSLDDGITGIYTCGGDLTTWNCQDPNKTWRTELWSVDGDQYRSRWGYTVTVTYETVTAPTSITGTTTICAGSSTTLTAVGGSSNAGSTPITTQWFTGSCGGTLVGTGTSISVSPSTNTTYFVRRVGQCSTTGCASVTVNVNPQNTVAAGQNRTVCQGSAMTTISLATTGATGATVTGLPSGVTGTWAGNVVTISGTPTVSGTFNYTVTTTGGCPPAITTGTITVNPLNTVAAGQNRTVCQGSAMTTISLATTGATGATVTGLPSGVTGTWAGNVVTISGTPTVSGTFNYTVTTTGGCTPAITTGTITVNTLSTTPTITPITGTICPNTNTVLSSVGGVAGSGSNVYWYTGPNGTGSLVGTGTTATVAPTANTTYYARREGTCNTTADASITVNVKNFVYAANGTSTNTYCTDNAGWHHFYSGDEIIFSVQGNISGAPVGYPVATIYDNGAYYQQTEGPGTAPGCSSNQNPNEERFEMERSWNVDMGGGAPSGTYNIRFYYQPAERSAIETAANAWMAAYPDCGYGYKYPTPNGFYWFKNSGSNYTAPDYEGTQYLATVSSVSGVNYAEWSGIPSFSGGSGAIILVPIATLPIELSSFVAVCNEAADEVSVHWTTASESNTSHFTIERSVDGSNWEVLGTTAAAGHSTITQNYSMKDKDVRGHSVIYYRLNQFDNDGASKMYGPTSAACMSEFNGFELFPNPAGSEVSILLHGEFEDGTEITFTDMNGKEVKKIHYQESIGKLMNVDLRNLEPGVYLVRVSDDEGNQFVRLVKQ